MKLLFYFHETALFLAVKEGCIEIIKILLANEKLDVNKLNIFNIFVFLKFTILYFNEIRIQSLQ